uniref:Uncharacterized protein n=1 Tax=Arundo donax TaxID=35708 RepID=A0A0A9BT46_ARUDO
MIKRNNHSNMLLRCTRMQKQDLM